MKHSTKLNKHLTLIRWAIGCVFIACSLTASAQTTESVEQLSVVRKSVDEERVANSEQQVITNFFKDNWIIFGDVGLNAFWGDYTVGNISTRLTPQYNIGVGKWFIPGVGAKIQFTGFNSKEYKSVETANTVNSMTYYDDNGNPYWRENIKWWDINANLMFNISRLITGYEGNDSDKLMNQFIASIGLGVTHHYDVPFDSNVVSGHFELQYSRFFSKKKNLSLDVRLRSIFYGTDFDRVNKQRIDHNLSLNVGLSYYFKERGWKRTVSKTTYYVEDLTVINQLNEEIDRLKSTPVKADPPVVVGQAKSKLITFPYLVNFVIDKVEVVNRERVNLKVVAEMIKSTPDQVYLVCGYADKHTGTVKRNIWLAEHRAKNVHKILTEEFGVPESQLVLDDKGGVENMFYDDPQLSRSAIITKYEGEVDDEAQEESAVEASDEAQEETNVEANNEVKEEAQDDSNTKVYKDNMVDEITVIEE